MTEIFQALCRRTQDKPKDCVHCHITRVTVCAVTKRQVFYYEAERFGFEVIGRGVSSEHS